MQRLLLCSLFLLGLAIPGAACAQTQTPPSAAGQSSLAADYPQEEGGVLIQDSSWKNMPNQVPAKTRVAHGIAASLSYGLVPGKMVAEYEGAHAPIEVGAGQPTICICHLLSIPGEPTIVRLQPKKGARELNGGKIIAYPLVGGSKMEDAAKSDWIPAVQEHPDPHVWLIRPQSPLPTGEYALMLGTQNLSIFPFTVVASGSPAAAK